jgi:Ca2+-binding RTX toxin-like protein
MAAIVATAAYAAPRVVAHTAVGTNGNDDLIAPFGAFGQQDTAYGLNGHDDIFGYIGDDELYGGNGQDRIEGYEDADYMVGGQGWDYLTGDAMLTPSKLLMAGRM